MRIASGVSVRAALRPVGIVLGGLGIGQALCAVAAFPMQSWRHRPLDEGSALAFATSAAVCLGASLAILFGARLPGPTALGRREAILAVALVWVLGSLVSAVPFVLDAGMTPVDALFEAVGGLTTTGSTVVADIEATLSRPLLLWRSIISWLGGMGIIVLFVAVAPGVGVGGRHLFRSEVTGATKSGLHPRIAETSLVLWGLYAAFTALLLVVLWLLGMSPFEALCHALTTFSTCGYSTRNASIAAWGSPAIELAVAVFILLSGVSFSLYVDALRQRSGRPLLRAPELRTYAAVVLAATAALTVAGLGSQPDVGAALRSGFFHAANFASSTGYTTDAYMDWPSAALGVMIGLMIVGGCSGSTAGGLKVIRAQLLGSMVWARLRRVARPEAVHVVRVGRRAVERSVLDDVAAFVVLFLATIAAQTLFVTAVDGTPVLTAFGATLAVVTSMGVSPWHIGADSFAGYSDAAKVSFSVAMILGRLEFFTLLALVLPSTWRR